VAAAVQVAVVKHRIKRALQPLIKRRTERKIKRRTEPKIKRRIERKIKRKIKIVYVHRVPVRQRLP
jgi:hypothetical protein